MDLYEFDSFRFDARTRLLQQDGREIRLPRKTADLLLLFVQRPGQVILKEELVSSVWPDAAVADNSLTFAIHQLREALGGREDGQSYIETLPKRGYRLIATVRKIYPEKVRTSVPVPSVEEPAHEKIRDLRRQLLANNQQHSQPARRLSSFAIIGAVALLAGAIAVLTPFMSYRRTRPPSASPTNALSQVDAYLKELPLGDVAFNAPRTMKVDEQTDIHVLASASSSVDQIRAELERRIGETRELEAFAIKLSPLMEAHLTGQNFTIQGVTPEKQAVASSATTEWQWEVTPRRGGLQVLHLTMNVIVYLHNNPEPRTVKTFDRTIKVEVSYVRRVTDWGRDNWFWLLPLMGAVIAIVKWKWKKSKDKKPRAALAKSAMGWKNYEEQTAELFRKLDCHVEIGATVEGARGKHKIDVWVKFARFGIETKWVVDCKYWRMPVTKEKVSALIGVVQDVGADRGVLVSQRSFQAGAVRAAEHTNVTLTSLSELERTAQGDLILSALHTLETRAIAVRYGLQELYSSERTGPGTTTTKLLPEVDGMAVLRGLGSLSLLESGFERARLGRPPFPVEFDETGNGQLVAMTQEQFVIRAAGVIERAEATLQANQQKASV